MNQNKKSKSEVKKKYQLKAQSRKGAASNRKYAEVCTEIDSEMLDDLGYIRCVSCHIAVGYIDHSHLLPKSLFPAYKTEKKNIAPRCRYCHNALDRNDFVEIKKFEDLPEIMEYLHDVEPLEYNKYVYGLRDAGCIDYVHDLFANHYTVKP